MTLVRGSAQSISGRTAAGALGGFTSVPCAPWTSPRAGSTSNRSGARASSAWVPRSTTSGRAYPYPSSASIEKLLANTRVGARAHRVYDRAQTPYQRLCATGVLPPAKRAELAALYQRLNPLQLRRELETALDRLWTLAAPTRAARPGIPR